MQQGGLSSWMGMGEIPGCADRDPGCMSGRSVRADLLFVCGISCVELSVMGSVRQGAMVLGENRRRTSREVLRVGDQVVHKTSGGLLAYEELQSTLWWMPTRQKGISSGTVCFVCAVSPIEGAGLSCSAA